MSTHTTYKYGDEHYTWFLREDHDEFVFCFTVEGTPRPQGSKRHVGGGRLIEQNHQQRRAWRTQVAETARKAWGNKQPLDLPARVEMIFEFPRPKNHYGTGRNSNTLKPDAARFPSTRNYGDIDKHQRAILDALEQAGVLKDDARVVAACAQKEWSQTSTGRVHVFVRVSDPYITRVVPGDNT